MRSPNLSWHVHMTVRPLTMGVHKSCIDGVMGLFFDKIRDQADGGKAIDFTKWTQFLMFDVVGELGFGGAFGQLRNEEDWKDIAHWVFLTLTAHASLGWTWFQSFVTLFPPARWLMNRTIYRHTKHKITAFPFPNLATVCLVPPPPFSAFRMHELSKTPVLCF